MYQAGNITIIRRFWRGIMLLSAALWMSAANAQTLDAPTYLSLWLQQPTLKFGDSSVDVASLRNAYATQGFRPLWLDDNQLSARGRAVVETLAQADLHGLNPARYGVSTIRAVVAMQPANAIEMQQRAMSLELLVSNGLLRYAADMQGGSVARQWDTGSDAVRPSNTAAALYQVAQSPNPSVPMESLAPQTQEYRTLRASLQRYRAVAQQGGWPSFPAGAKLTPGASDPRVEALRQILITQGDLASASYAAGIYDSATVEGVKRFQARHGIEPDGVIGKATQQALDTNANEYIQQLALTLERMRWMQRDLGTRYVLVNVPAYKLKAVSGSQQLAMDVIVGKPDTKTPMFSKEITNVVINPTWNVPAKIAIKEMLPKIRNNPDYLANAGFSVIGRDGEEVSASAIDWDNVGHGNFNYTLRQDAGDGNALGKVKFTIPDSDNIYLHDTSSRKLFARTERSLSHGCIRLSDPKAMTEFVLSNEGWSKDKIETAYDSSASRTVSISPLPVHLVYWTAWVDEKGQTHFSRDIYGMNRPLLLAMGGASQPEAIKLASR